ncbi:hypothetical protein [Kingella potus]|uniref:hypothetical protein n=1 Tax=Kingella potus TaxID=265175 RepID=UPI001FD4D715|nr:hypothetical protein [Kingella potus]UOP01459.1 hypothetical protein LVJ84_04440 [Kingella potus]
MRCRATHPTQRQRPSEKQTAANKVGCVAQRRRTRSKPSQTAAAKPCQSANRVRRRATHPTQRRGRLKKEIPCAL